MARVTNLTVPVSELKLITFGKQGPPIVGGGGFSVNGRAVSAQIDITPSAASVWRNLSTQARASASRRGQVAMSAFPTRIAGSPLAGQRAGLQDWHIGCSGCTGSAPHTREPRHLVSGALELGQSSRLESPNARAGRWSDRIRRTSDSGKGPISDVPLASAIRTGVLRGSIQTYHTVLPPASDDGSSGAAATLRASVPARKRP